MYVYSPKPGAEAGYFNQNSGTPTFWRSLDNQPAVDRSDHGSLTRHSKLMRNISWEAYHYQEGKEWGFEFAYVIVLQIPHKYTRTITSVSIELGKITEKAPIQNMGITGKMHSTSFLISGVIKQTNKKPTRDLISSLYHIISCTTVSLGWLSGNTSLQRGC